MDGAGLVEDGQGGHLVAAGDDDPAGAGSGEQRLDLLVVAGVVEHDEDLPFGQQAAQQARPGAGGLGKGLGRDSQGLEHVALGVQGMAARWHRTRAGSAIYSMITTSSHGS